MIKRKIFQMAMSLGLLPLVLSADDSCCPLVPGDPICGQISPGYFYPALYETRGCIDLAVSADFIYWSPNKQVNSYAIEHQIVGTAFSENTIIFHRFGYRPGFKVGAELGLRGFDHIVAHFEYMRFDNTTTSSRTAAVGNFITPLGGLTFPPPAPQAVSTRARSEWHFNFQWAELTVGRPCYLGQRLILSPFFGLKAYWFHQNQTLHFDLINGTLGTTRNKCNAWAIGPYINVGGKVLFCGGFYVLGKLGLSFPYLRYTTDDFTSDLPNTVSFQRDFSLDKKKPYMFQATTDSAVGFGWGSYFCSQAFHVNLELTYDYWSGLYLNSVTFGGYLPKDLYTHGLTVKGQFDF